MKSSPRKICNVKYKYIRYGHAGKICVLYTGVYNKKNLIGKKSYLNTNGLIWP